MSTPIPAETSLYLKQLCSMTGVGYTSLPLEKFQSLSDRKAINSLFFTLKEEGVPEERKIAIKKKIPMEELKTFFHAAGPIKKLKEQLTKLEAEASTALQKHNEILSNLIEKDRAIWHWQQREDLPVIQDIERLLEGGRVSLESVDKETQIIIFKTTNECILRHINHAAKLDITVNLGLFLIKINFAHSHITCLPGGNNVLSNGYFHPHLNNQGQVCWGNASGTIRDSFAIFDLKKLVETTLLVLNEYNSESPHVSLERLSVERKIRDRHGAVPKDVGQGYVYADWLASVGLLGKTEVFRHTHVLPGLKIIKVQIFAMRGALYVIDLSGDLHKLPVMAYYAEGLTPFRKESSAGFEWEAPLEKNPQYKLLTEKWVDISPDAPLEIEEEDEEREYDEDEEEERDED